MTFQVVIKKRRRDRENRKNIVFQLLVNVSGHTHTLQSNKASLHIKIRSPRSDLQSCKRTVYIGTLSKMTTNYTDNWSIAQSGYTVHANV